MMFMFMFMFMFLSLPKSRVLCEKYQTLFFNKQPKNKQPGLSFLINYNLNLSKFEGCGPTHDTYLIKGVY